MNTNGGGKAAALYAGTTYAGFNFSDDGYFVIGTQNRGDFTNNSVASGGAGQILTVRANGKVGLNTTEPAESLDVSGNTKTSGFFLGDASKLTNLPIRNAAVYTTTADGAQTIPLGAAATGIISVTCFDQDTQGTRTIWEPYCTIFGKNLTITADASIFTGDNILVKYYI